MRRSLYDCASVPLTPAGPQVRLVVATHDATSSSPAVGVERDGTVYELFVSTLPASAFTASDVLDLSLHRGSFETSLADEDKEQDSDRWYSQTPCGQEFAQILAQWIWNLRLELGQQLSQAELRTTEFAPACESEVPSTDEPEPMEAPTPAVISGPPQWARLSFTHGFPGSAFTPQKDWNPALSCQPPALSPGAASGTRWLPAGLVCCAHRSLPFLPLAGTVSRKQHHPEAATRECGIVAALLIALRCLASSCRGQSTASCCSRALARLATLWHPANLAQSDPHPDGAMGRNRCFLRAPAHHVPT